MTLRGRLVAGTVLVAVIALGGAGVATYAAFTSSQLRQVDDNLQRTHEPIEQLIDSGSTDLEGSIGQIAPGLFVAIIDEGGSTVLTIPARKPGDSPLVVDVDHLSAPEHATNSFVDRPAYSTRTATGTDIEVRVRVSRLDDGTMLVIGESLEEVDESARRLIVIETVVAAVALLVAAAVGWTLVHVGLRPLRAVEATALSIAEDGNLDQVVPGTNESNEVGRLARALETMLATIRQAFADRDAKELALQTSEQRMRQLVADVSHELRTPLAAVAAYTELIERGARERPEDLERALRGIGLEAARMGALVEELLLLARLDEGRSLERSRVDINEIVVDAVAAAHSVSHEWPISLRVSDLVVINGDPSRLRQVVDNLLANVRTHTPPATSISIELTIEGNHGVIVFSDNGPGMTKDQAAHIFERFYRADPSRSRSSGGAGLGMSIVNALVTAHDGRIHVDTAPGAGLTITIDLPLADAHDRSTLTI